jgi:maltooligosyltrehalose trehalohydrolase
VSSIRVWAPNVRRVRLRTSAGELALSGLDDGWWLGPELPAGTDYTFVLDEDEDALPDPASRRQPEGVHGPSRVYDQDAFGWHDRGWRGASLDGAVIYELHIGTFTEGATFDSAIERLDHLVRLGITHVEVLPVNAFNGIWNWGYDGVDWYAVHEPYGGPDGFKRFVDACHARGLAVVLDVVYNHLGPSGNYLPRFGPYLKSGRNTWGDLVNVEEPAVRRFVLDNALMWLRDFHVDALRLDAVHALQDSSPTHILAELSREVDALAAGLGRPLELIAESDLNDPVMITPRPNGGPPADQGAAGQGGYGLTAQWDDDVHHALHAALTGERQGYYCDFGSLAAIAKTFTGAFFHDGTYSTFRGRNHGKPIDRVRTPGWRFVVCLQNHDQVGNRAAGERLPELTSAGLVRVGAVLLLTGPFTPMLWMGEEWAASTRWPFFTSHPEPELAKRTGEGRLEEFAAHGWDTSRMIDPQDPAAYHEAVLRWDEVGERPHAEVLTLYRQLTALRAREPDLRDGDLTRVRVDYDEDERWLVVHRGGFRVVANLAARPRDIPADASALALATGQAEITGTGVLLGAETAAVVRV